MSFHTKRSALLGAGVVLAALVAAGCGSSGGATSGAGKAASSAGGLSFVPKTAVAYVTLDTDFSDSNWDRARKLGSKFPQYAAQRDKLMAQLNKGGTNQLKYDSDVKPWLGKDAGLAITVDGNASPKPHVVAWVASTDEGKTEAALTKGGLKPDAEYQGHKVWKSTKDKSYYTVADKYLVVADSEAMLHTAVDTKKSGHSITGDKTAIDAAKHVDSGSVVAFVMGREGLKSALKAAENSNSSSSAGASTASLKSALKQVNLNDFNGLAMGVSPKDHGVAVDGWVGNGGSLKLPDDATPSLLTGLPGDTAFAVTAQDLGGGIEALLKAATKSDPSMAAKLTQGEAALGLDNGALGKAFGGKFSLSASGTTPSVAVVFQNQGSKTKDTLDKLMNVGALAGAAPTNLTVKGGTGKQLKLGAMTIAEGSLSDVSIVTNTPAFINSWGSGSTLGGSAAYKRVIGEAGLPDKVGLFVYIDPQATAALGSSSLGSALTSKLGSAAAGAAGSINAGGSTPPSDGSMGADGSGPMGAMGGSSSATAMAAAKTQASEALKYLGPILMWSRMDSSNLELHAFAEIHDAK